LESLHSGSKDDIPRVLSKDELKLPKSPKERKEQQKSADPVESQPAAADQSTKVVVKQSGEKSDKKKSKFNYESVIEITLPPAAPNNPPMIQQPPIVVPETHNQSSQVEDEHIEEPITPVISSQLKPKTSSTQEPEISPLSRQESFVSNKQHSNMEWDSYTPVSCR
jgi:hypothetical protein